jgi:hypothetical protein
MGFNSAFKGLIQICQTAHNSQSLTFILKLERSLQYYCHHHNVTLVHDLTNGAAL